MTENENIFDDIGPNLGGWYCIRCMTEHPVNMVCLPEQFIWSDKINDFVPLGQKLSYYQ